MNDNLILNDWRTRTCTLATMHGKEVVIAPLLHESLSINVSVPVGFNTDQFGTFTRDITRVGNQLEAARAKARATLKLTGTDLALASEGSFGTHPSIPFVSSNLEIVVLIDTKHTIEIVGYYRTSAVQARGQTIHTPAEALAVSTSWGFPGQGVILRSSENNSRNIYKEIVTEAELLTRSTKLLSSYLRSSIFIETDMRAHRCPARRESIKAATVDLIKNCQSLCPACATPGFVITKVVTGAPCRACLLPTDRPLETIYRCQKCAHSESRDNQETKMVDPADCNNCNP